MVIVEARGIHKSLGRRAVLPVLLEGLRQLRVDEGHELGQGLPDEAALCSRCRGVRAQLDQSDIFF